MLNIPTLEWLFRELASQSAAPVQISDWRFAGLPSSLKAASPSRKCLSATSICVTERQNHA